MSSLKSVAVLFTGVALGGGLLAVSDVWSSRAHAGEAAPLAPTTYDPNHSLAPLVDRLGPAVVNLEIKQKVKVERRQMSPFGFGFPGAPGHPYGGEEDEQGYQTRQGLGSGFIISSDGNIITNNHVIADADEVTVKLSDGRSFDGKVIGKDDRTDIALVKIDTKGLPTVPLGSSKDLRVGDWVVAIGNPFGLDHTVTAGIVSAKGRVIGAGPYDDFIQTDASINPGNSGGPLFNLDGEVVGMNTAVSSVGQGIGFAVPIDMVKDIVDALQSDGKVNRGWIGVGLTNLDPDLKRRLQLDIDKGVVLQQVYPKTPAADAGLRAGDVLTSIDGQPVTESDALVRAIGGHRPGETVKLGLFREGKAKDISVKLGQRPEEEALASESWRTAPEPPEDKTPKEGRELGISVRSVGAARGGGLLVTSVETGSAAAGLLRPGDVILEVNQKDVSSAEDLSAALRGAGEGALLVVQRRGGQVLIDVPLEARAKAPSQKGKSKAP